MSPNTHANASRQQNDRKNDKITAAQCKARSRATRKAPTPKARTRTDETPSPKPKTKAERIESLNDKRGKKRSERAELKKNAPKSTLSLEEKVIIEEEKVAKEAERDRAMASKAERIRKATINRDECREILRNVHVPSVPEISDEAILQFENVLCTGKVKVSDVFGNRLELTPLSLARLFYDDEDPMRKCAPTKSEISETIKSMIRADKHNAKIDLDRTFAPDPSKKHKITIIDKAVQSKLDSKTTKRIKARITGNMSFLRWLSFVSENPRYKYARQYAEALDAVSSYESKTYKAPTSTRKFVVDVGPTNSGKTHSGMMELIAADSGVYLGPLRLLAMEVAEELNENGTPCSMVTGEESHIVQGAMHVASTVEMLDRAAHYSVAVIDECQMISDPERGYAWAAAIVSVDADVVHLCMAPESCDMITAMLDGMNEEYEIIEHERLVPLSATSPIRYPKDIKQGDALIVFSRKSVQSYVSDLRRKGIKASMVYGALPYNVRREEVRKFADGETQVVVATDAIGMGLNLPVRRVIFAETEKFDGVRKRELLPSEIKQIAGRAGRYGKYDHGYATATTRRGSEMVSSALDAEIESVTEMRVDMPRDIIGFDQPLSMLMRAWQMNKLDYPYMKRDLSPQIDLARRVEDLPNELVAEAIEIPFASGNRYVPLDDIWEDAVRVAARGRSTKPVLFDVDIEDRLQYLEDAAKVADLAYGIAKRYGSKHDLDIIDEARREISELMIKKLSESKNDGTTTTCTWCGHRIDGRSIHGMHAHCYDEYEQMTEFFSDNNDMLGDDIDDVLHDVVARTIGTIKTPIRVA